MPLMHGAARVTVPGRAVRFPGRRGAARHPASRTAFATVSAALILVAVLASYVPARRGADVDLATALRTE
jgi:hypothetical protein